MLRLFRATPPAKAPAGSSARSKANPMGGRHLENHTHQDPCNATEQTPAAPPQTYQAFMREWVVSSGVVSRSLWWVGALDTPTACSADRGLAVRSGDGCAPWLVGHGCCRLQPRCGARRFGAWAFIRHARVWLAWSVTATATAGLIHMRRPAPVVGSCLISSSQPLPCPNLTQPPSSSGSHRHAARRTPR